MNANNPWGNIPLENLPHTLPHQPPLQVVNEWGQAVSTLGYNDLPGATNQPYATYLANALEVHYKNIGFKPNLSRFVLSPNETLFLKGYLRVHDVNKYEKVFTENDLNNSLPKYNKLSNTKKLRDGLRNLP
jgi:hypothetical protein